MSREILNVLVQLKSLPKFQGSENELKLQQMLAMLISKNVISLKRLTITHNIINALFSLENAKSRVTWNKTLAAMTQIIGLCINELQENPTTDNKKIMTTLLNDLVMLSRGENPKWIFEVQDPPMLYCVFSEILDNKFIISNKQ